MARVSFGPLISDIAGSVGQACFRRSSSGAVLYNKPLPSRKNSATQLAHRAIFSAAAVGWKSLDADIRKAWDSLAAQTQVPSYFSRGRSWRGKDLYTCFFTYAEHQLTPLPARWLPQPPLFYEFGYCTIIAGMSNGGPDYQTIVYLSAYIPNQLNPLDPGGLSSNICNSFFFGFCPPMSRKMPRRFVKIAPVPTYLNSIFSVPPTHYSSYSYDGWQHAIGRLLGEPIGVPYPTEFPIPSPYSVCYARFCVTDKRIYYTAPSFADPHSDPFGAFPSTSLVNNYIPLKVPTVAPWSPTQNIPTTEY